MRFLGNISGRFCRRDEDLSGPKGEALCELQGFSFLSAKNTAPLMKGGVCLTNDQDLREVFSDAVMTLLLLVVFIPIKRILDQAIGT